MEQTAPADRRAIRALRRHGFSRRGTAALTGWSRPTVRRYEPDEVEGHDESLSLDWADIEPALPDDTDAETVISPEFRPAGSDRDGGYIMPTELYDMGMSVNEALETGVARGAPESLIYLVFKDIPLVSPSEEFIEHICQRTERLGKLPEPDLLGRDLTRLSKTSQERAEMFVREYREIKEMHEAASESESAAATHPGD